MESKRTKIRTAHVICIVASSLGVITDVESQVMVKDPRERNVQEHMKKILEHPLFATLPLNADVFARTDEAGAYLLPDEKVDHKEGIFGIRNVSAIIWDFGSPRYSIYSDSRVRIVDARSTFVSEMLCRNHASSLLAEAYPWFLLQGPLPHVKVLGPTRQGNYTYEWQRYRSDELPDTRMTATVRAIDGRIVNFSSSKFMGVWEHKISPTQARDIALADARKDTTKVDMEVASWGVTGGASQRFYEIVLQAKQLPSGFLITTGVQVNAMTGAITRSMEGWSSAKGDPKPPLGDATPAWVNQNLAFVSPRLLYGMPDWAPNLPQLLLRAPNSSVRYLTQDLEVAPKDLFCLPNSSWLAFERNSWIYALDTSSGDYRVLSTPKRPALTAGVSPDGKWAIISATSNVGQSGYDLFADNLNRGADLQLRARLVLPGSDEHHPLFSPDNKWLYFISTKEEKGQVISSLCRIAASVAHTKQMVRLRPEQVETVIASLPEDLQRLSFYPSGQKLLLQGQTKMFVLDVKGRKATALSLPQFRDAELGNVAITKLEGGWAGPNEDEVTFSGETMDVAKVMRRRIYSCNLDGKNFKALTPKDNTPVKAFQFKQSKKNATDLAKDWALSEIKWQEAHQDR